MSKLEEVLAKAVDAVPPTKTLDCLAGEVGGNVLQVKEILAGRVACPDLPSLRGIAHVLGIAFEDLRAAAEADGCEYDAEGLSVSCPLSRRIKVAEMESARLKRGLGARAIAQRQRAVAESVSAAPPKAPEPAPARQEQEAPERDLEMESLAYRAVRGDQRALVALRQRRESKGKRA